MWVAATGCLLTVFCSTSDRSSAATTVFSAAGSPTTTRPTMRDATSTSGSPAHAPVILSCADAGSATVPTGADDISANGVSFSGSAQVTSRPTFELTEGSGSHPFQKLFLYVSTKATPQVRLTVIDPADAYLDYVPEEVWQSVQPDHRHPQGVQ